LDRLIVPGLHCFLNVRGIIVHGFMSSEWNATFEQLINTMLTHHCYLRMVVGFTATCAISAYHH
jgi:hypothetical protein